MQSQAPSSLSFFNLLSPIGPSALYKRNIQPMLYRFKTTVPRQQLSSNILQKQPHKSGTRKRSLKFRDRTLKTSKDHRTKGTRNTLIKIIIIGGKRHANVSYLDYLFSRLGLTNISGGERDFRDQTRPTFFGPHSAPHFPSRSKDGWKRIVG